MRAVHSDTIFGSGGRETIGGMFNVPSRASVPERKIAMISGLNETLSLQPS
jgi:hypothetical protein